jgi:hypothetical protein
MSCVLERDAGKETEREMLGLFSTGKSQILAAPARTGTDADGFSGFFRAAVRLRRDGSFVVMIFVRCRLLAAAGSFWGGRSSGRWTGRSYIGPLFFCRGQFFLPAAAGAGGASFRSATAESAVTGTFPA